MCSNPGYDSNAFVLGLSEKNWESLNSDERNPLYNRASGTWVPGSSFKPVIAAIGLSTNLVNASDDFGESGKEWQKDDSWGTYKITTISQYSGPANLRNALVYSDNIYFGKLALKIGKDKLASELNKIGFNKELEFPIAVSSSKFASGNEFESEIQLADSGYGQGKILVSNLHMASIYSAFVNEGNMIMPYIEYKENAKPEYYVKNAFTKEAAQTIKDDLIQVIEDAGGTAHNAKINNVTLAGKTGTAEIKNSKDDTEGSEIGWFCAFTADEAMDKQVLVVSMCEDVDKKPEKGYVTSRVKAILSDILNINN